MSDNAKEVEKEVEVAVEKVLAEEVKAEVVEEVKAAVAPAEAPVAAEPAVEETKVAEPAAKETKAAEPVEEPPAAPQPVEVPVTETVEKVVDQFENMTIFGNKSLDELQKIQSKKSHLSAGKCTHAKESPINMCSSNHTTFCIAFIQASFSLTQL